MNEFTLIKGYFAAAADLVQTVIEVVLLPKQMILDDNNEPPALIGSDATLSNISSASSFLNMALTFVYYYDLYYDEKILVNPQNKVLKWLNFGMLVILLISIGIHVFFLQKKFPEQGKKIMNVLSGYILPPLGLALAVITVILAHKSDKTSREQYILAYFDLTFGIVGMWKLTPVKIMVLNAKPLGPVVVGGLLGLKAGAGPALKTLFLGK